MAVIALRQPTTMDRVSKAIANLALTALTVLASVFVVTIVYPWDPIAKVEIAVVGQPIAGKDLIVSIDYCKSRAWTPTLVRWSLMNDVTVVLPTTTASLPTGCHVKRLAVPIPLHVAPGEYRLQEELTYQPWPWKYYTYVRQSQTFTLKGAS